MENPISEEIRFLSISLIGRLKDINKEDDVDHESLQRAIEIIESGVTLARATVVGLEIKE